MILWLAPMDGITDLPYRIITKRIFEKYNKNPNLKLRLWTEFMTSDWYIANPHKVIKHIIHTDFEQPLILQIFWWNEKKILKTALDIQEKYWKNIAWIELNTGCPANNVMKSGWWSALLKDKEKLLETIKELSKNLKIPFSIKTRTWLNDEDKKTQMKFLIKASKYCHMISVHSRTLKDLYKWNWDRDFIYELKSKVEPKCKIIWNGWINYHQEIKTKIKNSQLSIHNSQLDWIMIWQAAIGNPWIFTEHIPSTNEIYKTIIEHFELMAKYEIFTSDLSKEDCHSEHSEESINTGWKNNKTLDSSFHSEWQRPNKINPKLNDIESIDIESNYDKIYYSPLLFRKYLHQYLKWIPWWKELKELCNKTKDFQENIEYIKTFFEK